MYGVNFQKLLAANRISKENDGNKQVRLFNFDYAKIYVPS